MNKQEKEELAERKKKQAETELWMKIIFVPLVVGFALVFSGITMILFIIIGWFLFIFGIVCGLFYAFQYREKLKRIKDDFLRGLRIFKKPFKNNPIAQS